MSNPGSARFAGREFTKQELDLIVEVTQKFPLLSRRELAHTVCELLGWERTNGRLKARECVEMLEGLDARGVVRLPALRRTKPRGSKTRQPVTGRGEPGEPLVGSVEEIGPITLTRVEDVADRELWRELVGRYHYLGCAVPFGAHLRYLIRLGEGVVGCLQFSSPAWRMAARDRWIGWEDGVRERNLQRIVSNSRFLVLPWVRVRNLASRVLSVAARRLRGDWRDRYGTDLVLIETLVERERFGGCYRAANWIEVGTTAGRGRMDRHHDRHGAAPKRVFVYPLVADAARQLCGVG